MNFKEAVQSVLRQYATFRGRAPRAEYWWFYLFTVLVGIATGILDSALGTNLLNPLASLALLLPTLAVSVRRLHDSNLSGWWILAPMGCAILGVVLVFAGVGTAFVDAANGPDNSHMTGAAVTMLLLGVVVILVAAVLGIVLMLRGSTPGPNRFGPHPHGQGGAAPYGGSGAPYADQYGQYGQPGQHGGQPGPFQGYGTPQGGQYGGQYGGGSPNYGDQTPPQG